MVPSSPPRAMQCQEQDIHATFHHTGCDQLGISGRGWCVGLVSLDFASDPPSLRQKRRIDVVQIPFPVPPDFDRVNFITGPVKKLNQVAAGGQRHLALR